MIEKFINHIKDKDLYYTIFDIGSRDCLQSIEFYHAFPNAKIYAFECNPNTIDICRENIKPYSDRITLFNFAISNFNGLTKFYPINQQKTKTTWKDGNPGASSLFVSNGTYTIENYVQDEIDIECRRLDTLMENNKIIGPDILWMDLQGAELLALEGLGQYIKNVLYIHTEISHKPIYNGQVLYEQLDSFLKSKNFEHNTNINKGSWQQDIIYFQKTKSINQKDSTALNDLTHYKSNKYSQRGHDGILEKILYEIDINQGFFVEVGGSDGISNSNCKNLFDKGWSGIFIEADDISFNKLCKNYSTNSDKIKCIQAKITPDTDSPNNLNTIISNNTNSEIDILCIDIDGRDYEILENLSIKPKLILIEGGFYFHPSLRTKIPNNIAKNNIQQPIYVTIDMAKKKGYSPICFNQDLFLLRNDLYHKYEYFQNIANDHISLWKSGYYNIFNDAERCALNRIRNNTIIKEYEHPYLYQNLESSIKNAFDIVIPVGPKDNEFVYKQIEKNKANIIGYRNIYLISGNPNLHIDGCISVPEDIFPFSMRTIQLYHSKLARNGWYLQQLIKLYAGLYIEDILDKYLVVDTDTFFLKPTNFIDANGKCLYSFGTEYHIPYFEHMKLIDPSLTKVDKQKSGIVHHMIFETKYISELISLVENNHKDKFFNVFLKYVDPKHREYSGASEYEIYFNFMLSRHIDDINIRHLKFRNVSTLDEDYSDLDYISNHAYMRK